MNFAVFIIPIFIIVVLIYASIKRVNSYECFVSGAKQSVDLIINTFPYLVAIFAVVELLSISGISAWLSSFISPVFTFLGIPAELVEFLILRPFTGSGSIAMLSSIFAKYGADSLIAKCACVIMSCTETTFYVVAVYFSTTRIKKLRYTIPVCLLSAFIGAIIACLFCRIFFL
ncbi:MAG: spore maturation protein [Clostridia bacterium]|nr:spore maturation protein [Clostridia bacterium]